MTDKWPADCIERRDVSSLIPYANNARTHSDDQVAQLAATDATFDEIAADGTLAVEQAA